MPYLPVTFPYKKANYKVYVESKGAMAVSKSHAIELALAEALKDESHVTEVDFIPGMFVVQLHGWCSQEKDPFKSAAKFQKAALLWAKQGKDIVKEAENSTGGKFHIDCRIWKFSAPSWFGITFFSSPWFGTAENKVLGTVKGIGVQTKEGAKTQQFLIERATEKGHAIMEKQDRLFWLKVKSAYWAPGTIANPTKTEWSYMVVVDKGYCIIHRRENDFIDVTFLGKLLNGRYYDRLVARELKEEEKPVTKEGKPSVLNFYFWKAKQGQFDPDLMLKVARGEIYLSPLEQAEVQKGEEPTLLKKA